MVKKMNKARYIKTCYSRKKYEKAEFRKSQWYEYRGYEYFIYPDAYFITGCEVWRQHKEEQDKIDKMIEEQEKDRKYREEHREEIRRSEQALNDFFRLVDGEISYEEYDEILKKNGIVKFI